MKKLYGLWILSICVLPFFQGGYFYFESLFFGVVQGVVLLGITQRKMKSNNANYSYLIIFYLLIVLGSAVSTFTAIDKGMHLVGFLKLIVPFIFLLNLNGFYKYFSKKVFEDMMFSLIIVAVIMSCSVVVVLLIMSAESELFKHFVQNSRIGGYFQYANTFGIYLYGSLILLFVSNYPQKFRIPSGFIIMAAIILTQSRGTYIIVGLSLLLLSITSLYLKISYSNIAIYISTIIGGVFGQLLIRWLGNHMDTFRAVTISGNSSEWLSRLLYYEDSIPMIFRRLTGYGHLGYYYTQQSFQTGASYKVKFLHNSVLQIMLDYGLLAGIGLILIGLFSIYLLAKYRISYNRKSNEDKFKIIILTIGGLGIFGHSIIDFDFQFTSMLILYLFLIAYMEQLVMENVKYRDGHIQIFMTKLQSMTFTKNLGLRRFAILIFVILFTYLGIVSYLDYESFSVKAFELYPFYTDAVDGIIRNKSTSGNISDEEKLDIVLESVERNLYYLNGFAFLRDTYYNNGDLITALEYSSKVCLLAPLKIYNYEIHVKLLIEYVVGLQSDNLLTIDNEYLKQLLNMKSYMKKLKEIKMNNYNVKHKVDFVLTKDMEKILYKAYEIYGEIQ